MGKVISLEHYKEKYFNRRIAAFFYASESGFNILKKDSDWRTQHFKEVMGHYFRTRRKEQGISVEALARAMKIDTSIISRFEQGIDSLNLYDVKKLFIAIGLSDFELNLFLIRLNEYFSGNNMSLRSLQVLFDVKQH